MEHYYKDLSKDQQRLCLQFLGAVTNLPKTQQNALKKVLGEELDLDDVSKKAVAYFAGVRTELKPYGVNNPSDSEFIKGALRRAKQDAGLDFNYE